MKFVELGFVMVAGLCPLMVEGQTLSFFKPLAGSNNGYAMLVDASGVYTFDDRFRKYDLDGAAVWSREHPRGQTVAWLASSGAGLYAAGHIPSPVGISNAFVRLYDLQGNEVWNRQFGFPNSQTINRATAADATGVYVAGTINANGVTSFYLRKYDDGGTELWTKRSVENFGALAVDSTGVYVRGGGSFRKYDRDGNEVWARVVDGNIQPYDMKANATGVYLTGFDAKKKEYFLSRYDSSGNEVWIRYGQSGWIATDANSVYVTAYTTLEPGQCSSGLTDVFVIRYDLDGKTLWTRQFGTYRPDYPRAIAADSSGVFVAGIGIGQSFLAKLDPASVAASASEPRIRNECVLNAASYIGGAVSPGEIVTIFGTAIGPSQLASARADRDIGTELGGTRVLFDSIPAPLLYAYSGQVGAVVPNSVSSKSSVNIQVEYRGTLSKAVTLPVLKAHPGILNVLNEDGNFNAPDDPARRGSIISIYGTGGGETNPATPDGQVVGTAAPLNAIVSVYLGEDPVSEEPIFGSVLYAGALPGYVAGLLQVNVRLPETLPLGSVQPILFVGESQIASPESVRVWIK